MEKLEKQGTLDPLSTYMRMRILGITGRTLAKRLNRSEMTVSLALKGKRKKMLGRINRYLDRVERQRKQQNQEEDSTPN